MNTIETTTVFDAWFASLKDKKARAIVQVRIARAEAGNFGDCKSVGCGVSEMRIDFGPGYRVYYIQVGLEVYFLLAGGDKSTQTKDIEQAQLLAETIKGQRSWKH